MASDYTIIQGDQARKVEQGESFRKEFKIDGVDSGASSIVMLMVKGLTQGDGAEVLINDASIGKIHPFVDASAESWMTYLLNFSASEGSLKPNAKDNSETNVLEIKGAANSPKFYVQNLVIHYKTA